MKRKLMISIMAVAMMMLCGVGHAEVWGGGPRVHSGALLIAASDSSAIDKFNAWKTCDGTADQVEIHAAFAAAAASSNSEVFLLAGTYAISDSIDMVADIGLSGTWASKLTLAAGSDVPIIDGSAVDGFTIYGLYLDGNTANNTLSAHEGIIHLDNCDKATVARCYVTGSDATGILVTDSDGLEISFCYIIENGDDGIELFDSCDDAVISGNRLIDNSTDDLPQPSGNLKIRNNCSGISITGNTIRTQYKNNVVFFTSTSATPNSGANSFTVNTVVTTTAGGYGINLKGSATGSDVRFWNISVNGITAADGTGIMINTWVRDTVISGNSIIAKVGTGSAASTFERVSLVGNVFTAYPGSTAGGGTRWFGTGNNIMIANNLFHGFQYSAVHLAGNFAPTNCAIIGNTATGGIDVGVYFYDTSNDGATNLIYGNNFTDCDVRFHNDSDGSADTIPTSWSTETGNIPVP